MPKWIKTEKQLPANHTRAIVWANGVSEQGWFSGGKWHRYNGTFMLTEKDRIDGVTHWMEIDWMYSRDWPLYGPGVWNRAKHLWQRVTDKTGDMAYDLRPRGWGSKAQLSKKVTFYRDKSGRIMTGMPENVPTPRGLERIVCGSALEAERYSSIQRRQDQAEHRLQQYERGAIEEAQRDQIRSERRTLIANARNSVNRDFLIAANERFDRQHKPWQYERESYLHAEAFEDKH